jgi:predicted RND superfamily exporter protein
MIIVGTSDVIHLMTKYVDELRFGKSQRDALRITLKEIGLATFLTSATTAIGFATLLTSRVGPIRDFGVNAGIGVLVAYITVITFTMALLTLFNQDQIMRTEGTVENWDKWLLRLNVWVKNNTRIIAWGTTAAVIISLIGISMVNTNYSIIGNMPRGAKITSDLQFYESEFTGFRPFELAVFAQPGYKVTDFKVLQEMDKIENAMRAEPALRAISSQTALVKSVNQAMTGGTPEDYRLPEDEAAFAKIAPMLARAPSSASAVLVNKNGDKARISSRALDIGSDSIRNMAARIANFGKTELDTSVIKVQETGTGLLLDKNSVYVRESLLWGLGGAVLLISFLMALLFRDWKMLFVALVPNILPLLLAGALLGFLGIDLEAGIAIVFAIIFGIAVDDSIHFLAKYRLVRGRGIGQDEAIATTFRESGKAIILTSLILFFGFLSLLFSVHPPSVAIGLLISVTLASAVLADLLIIPVMLRWLVK